MKKTAQIFLCHARQDEAQAKELYNKLELAGFDPWMDTVDLVGGEKWAATIQKIIPKSDFFIACLSKNSVNKRGFLQREISVALDALRERLDDDIYIIPLRLEECNVPESLSLFHWVDHFAEDGWDRFVKAIHKGMEIQGLIPHIILRAVGQFMPFDKAMSDLKSKRLIDENELAIGIPHFYEERVIGGKKLIVDYTTGLMWQCSGSEKLIKATDAKNYVRYLKNEKFAGFDDWRLPTLEEAISIRESEGNNKNGLFINEIFDSTQKYLC